jgi:hypothetical protein
MVEELGPYSHDTYFLDQEEARNYLIHDEDEAEDEEYDYEQLTA